MTQSLLTLKEPGVQQRKRQVTKQLQPLTESGTQNVPSRCRINGCVVRALWTPEERSRGWEGGGQGRTADHAAGQADDWPFTKPASLPPGSAGTGLLLGHMIHRCQHLTLRFPWFDTLYSEVYSPVCFFFQLMPAQMKLTSDLSCPNEVRRRPENKWISLDETVTVNILYTSKIHITY